LKRILRIASIDSDGLINAQPNQPPPDPKMVAIQAKAEAEKMANQIDQAKLLIEKQKAQADFQDQQQERAFKERMQQVELYLEQLRVKAEMIIHAHDIHRDNQKAQTDMQVKQAGAVSDIMQGHAEHRAGLAQDQEAHQHDMAVEQHRAAMQMQVEHAKNQNTLAVQRQQHEQNMQLTREKHAAELENQKKIAEAKAQAIGPSEQEKSAREGEKHDQQMQIDAEKHKRDGEKHKVELETSKKMAAAKIKQMNKPKPKPAGGK
jgi:hypothetical protein